MVVAETLDEYLAQPVGRYFCGPTFVIWWLSARLNGIMFWGRSEEDHIRTLTTALHGEFAPDVAPHASIIDARNIDGVDLSAFNALSSFVHKNGDSLARVVTGQAVLRPGGFVGAAVAGFHAVLGPTYPTRVFADPAVAVDWLGVRAEASVLAELDDIRTRLIGDSYLVSALRIHLEQRPGAVSLRDAAAALGFSPRDLQRKLRAAHTRFQAEQKEAQVRLAKRLLLDSNHDLKRIAFEVGCASAQHFSVLFRDVVGESPSQWRARQRPDLRPERELG